MRKTVTKLLRKLSRGSRTRYLAYKSGWNNTPRKKRKVQDLRDAL